MTGLDYSPAMKKSNLLLERGNAGILFGGADE
jgi:hypothetical protein